MSEERSSDRHYHHRPSVLDWINVNAPITKMIEFAEAPGHLVVIISEREEEGEQDTMRKKSKIQQNRRKAEKVSFIFISNFFINNYIVDTLKTGSNSSTSEIIN